VTLQHMAGPLLVGLVLLSIGCQYVSGVNDLEIVTSIEAAPDWSCLGHSSNADVSGSRSYARNVLNLATDEIISDAVVRLCESHDVDCQDPLPGVETTNGTVRFTVDASFNGYLELESPEMLPGRIELSRPIGKMHELPDPRMVDPVTLNRFAAVMGVAVNPAYGHALFWVNDCANHRAPGVAVEALGELTPDTDQYYVVDKRPSNSLDRTEDAGGGGFINLPETFMTFRARRAETLELISTFPGRIRAGRVTFMMIEPD
jgi:hypothetical protein